MYSCQLLMSELHNTVIFNTTTVITRTYLYFHTNFFSSLSVSKKPHFLPCWHAYGVLTMRLLPSTSWCCLQKGPKNVRSPPPWNTNDNSHPLGKKEFMTFLCIIYQKKRRVNNKPSSRGDAVFLTQDEEDRHIFFSLQLLSFCSRFLGQKYIYMCTDSKPCCSCC